MHRTAVRVKCESIALYVNISFENNDGMVNKSLSLIIDIKPSAFFHISKEPDWKATNNSISEQQQSN